jgi:hypothetical protein
MIVLDSRNGTEYNSSYHSEITFDIKFPIIIPKDCLYAQLCVQSFTSPISWYLINETNSLLSITLNSITYTINIPYGNYNSQNFQVILLSLLPTGFSISLNSYNSIFSLSHLSFDFSINSSSTIYQIMGFKQKTSYSSTSKSLTLPFTCNFSGLNSINILIENLITSNLDSHNGLSPSSIISTIPINNSQGGMIYFQKYNDFCFDLNGDTINYLDILICDDLDNKINFNNQHWNLILQVTLFRELEKPIEDTFNDILVFGKNTID